MDERAVFGSFIEEPIGQCVFYTGSGCTISRAYYSSPSAETELSNVAGSKNGLDILFRQSKFEVDNVGNSAEPKFNHCQPTPSFQNVRNGYEYFAYETEIHAAGHALGTSGSFVPEHLVEPVYDRFAYLRGHPSIPGAVMNYDDQVPEITNEPDCSPHPFDVLAIYALYQTID